jgi:hypothetical protein
VGGWPGGLEDSLESVLGSSDDSAWLRESQSVSFLLLSNFLPLVTFSRKLNYSGLELEASWVSSSQILDVADLGDLHNVDGVVLGLVARTHFSICSSFNPSSVEIQKYKGSFKIALNRKETQAQLKMVKA